MDSNNNQPSNPILNSDSVGAVNPDPAVAPVSNIINDAPVEPVAPGQNPVDSASPVAPADPVNPVSPVNPIINPGDATGAVNPIIQPSGDNGLAATDPIMKPEPVPEPDPVEEELKAPMKANAPVPGSIGSAVSGPAGDDSNTTFGDQTTNPFANNMQEKTTNVSFNDPAMQPNSEDGKAKFSILGNKSIFNKDKKLLIALAAVVAVVVVVLIICLVAL